MGWRNVCILWKAPNASPLPGVKSSWPYPEGDPEADGQFRASGEACWVKPRLSQGLEPSGFRCHSADKLLLLLPVKNDGCF